MTSEPAGCRWKTSQATAQLAKVRVIIPRQSSRAAICVVPAACGGIPVMPTAHDNQLRGTCTLSSTGCWLDRHLRDLRPDQRMDNAMKPSDVLSSRLRAVRLDMYGEHGAPLLAAAIGVPVSTWIRYELGATIPGLVLLHFIEVTGVQAQWLLTGEGQRYRVGPEAARGPLR
jgi:hypothetical protein